MRIIIFFLVVSIISCQSSEQKKQEPKENKVKKEITFEYAKELAHKFIIVDGHIDLPYRLEDKYEDVSVRTETGHCDYPRFKEGGLDAPFMSIYIPASYQRKSGAKELATSLIGIIEEIQNKYPDKFKIAKSVTEVKENFEKGLISFPFGMENGAGIEDNLENLDYFYKKGIRYITLCHSENNLICGSSYERNAPRSGLTEFGKQVVEKMNKIGIMVDISHVSDKAFWDILKVTKTPVIASHSSCRRFTPGMERNMSDEMIKALAENGGIIMINFGTYFINGEFQSKMDKAYDYVRKHKLTGNEKTEFYEKYRIENKVPDADIKEVVTHIKHVAELVGIDYIGFGSDFDGVAELPVGLTDVSMYPNLIYELLKEGFTEEDIKKMCSGNIFRVWSEVENYASKN
ncbi:MAG: dipeptidase [Ignavibacteria bacterium]|jgi:membrane dipeptidase